MVTHFCLHVFDSCFETQCRCLLKKITSAASVANGSAWSRRADEPSRIISYNQPSCFLNQKLYRGQGQIRMLLRCRSAICSIWKPCKSPYLAWFSRSKISAQTKCKQLSYHFGGIEIQLRIKLGKFCKYLSIQIPTNTCRFSANTKCKSWIFQKQLTGYKMAQKLSRFVADRISLHWQPESFSVGRRPTSVLGDLYAQIITEFF